MAELGSRAWLDYRNLILIGHRTRTVLRTAQTLIGEEFASYRADAVPGKDPDRARREWKGGVRQQGQNRLCPMSI